MPAILTIFRAFLSRILDLFQRADRRNIVDRRPVEDVSDHEVEAGQAFAFTGKDKPDDRPGRWIVGARPAFLYVMYAIILWSLPLGITAAISPPTAGAIADAMNRYLAGLPEPLYALFATGYLGYATLRQWGKVKGTDR